MRVQQLMTKHVEWIPPDETIQNAARKMKELGVGSLPVCDNDLLVGMVTDRDIVIRGVSEGAAPEETFVREVMSLEITCCFEDQDPAEASQLMKEKHIHRLVVLNRDKRPVGVLSIADMAADPDSKSLAEETLQSVSRNFIRS